MLYILSLLIVAVSAEFDHEIHEKYISLPRAEFVEFFNSLNKTWKIKEDYEERSHHYCSFINSNITFPTVRHDLNNLNVPDNFDAREQWSQCASIGTIYDQGECGSCWTFGTAGTASDRNCIHANINLNLSEQDLACCTDCFSGKNVCSGGDPTNAFQFWINSGLVTSDCLPYDINSLKSDNACTKTCVNGEDYTSLKNYGGSVNSVPSDEDQIKAELYKNGPIQASMYVFEDFKQYNQGVYVHTHGKGLGWHSIRIIGYGVENGEKYWLLANSWGTNAGENGFFKVQPFQADIHLEESLLAPMPKNA